MKREHFGVTRHGRAALQRSLTACLLLVLVLALPSCQSRETIVFPTLGTTVPTGSQTSQPSGSQATETNDGNNLKVALPLNQDTFAVVRLLYLAKKSGLINQEPGQYIGQQINPDDLRQFDQDLSIDLETLPVATGATLLQVSLWQASAQLPDIIYCQDMASSLGLDQVRPLNDLLFDNSLLAASHIYPQLLAGVQIDEKTYGIPYLVTTPLLYINVDLLDQLQLDPPSADWDWQDFGLFVDQAQEAIGQAGLSASPASLDALADNPDLLAEQLGRAVFVLDNPAALLPYVPASLSEQAGYAMWSGQVFRLNDAAFKSAAQWLGEMTRKGCSMLHLTADERALAFPDTDNVSARQSGRLLCWIGDSSDVESWQQSSFAVQALLLPAGKFLDQPGDGSSGQNGDQSEHLSSERRLPATVRCLFVSRQCQKPDLAADFAAFVALDADALLLQSRYQLFEGMFPAVEDQIVWDAMVGRQRFGGSVLTGLKSRVPFVYCSGQQKLPVWQDVLQIIEQDLGPQLLLADRQASFNDMLDELVYAVSRKIKEG